jgi:hypothetical protein
MLCLPLLAPWHAIENPNVPILKLYLCRYLMSLDKNPIATKAVTSAVLTLAEDLICQVQLQHLASV